MSRSASELLRSAGVQVAFEGWSLLEVTGGHRERFLHSQVTSDVRGLPAGESQLSALLDRSGRLVGFFFLLKRTVRIELLVPDGAAQGVQERLQGNVIADDVSVARREVGPMRLALGPEAVRIAGDLRSDDMFPLEAYGSRGFVTWTDHGLDLPAITAGELEALRVVSGLPRWGVEASGGMLVNETSLIDGAVSFAKGCFLGQETVAKVASHRGAAYRPMLLEVASELGDPQALVGRTFAAGDRARAGTVLSWTSWEGETLLQASLHRELRVPGRRLHCRFGEGFEIEASVAELPRAVAPDPAEQADELHGLAVDAFTRDLEDEAVRLLERAIAVCPHHADSYESLGVILGRHGRYQDAIRLMERLLEVDPQSVMAHTNMSLYLSRLGRIEEAEREASHAARKEAERRRRDRETEEEAERARRTRAADLERREQMFREVLHIDPDDPLGNFGMGELCVDTGRFEDAVLYLQRAIRTDSDYSAAYLALGRAWEGMRESERAREVYSAGVEVAARRGDLATASRMQGRLGELAAAGG